MKAKCLLAAAVMPFLALISCDDDVSPIGGSLANGEVTISVDSLETRLDASTIHYESFDGRNVTKLLGRISVPEYGSLSCSFVSQMLSSTKMNVPDSITEEEVDSMRLVLSVPRGSLTGDSLAPQQLRVYRLTKELPADITTTFNPDGYFASSSLLGKQTYTLSNIARGDSALKKDAYVRIPVKFPLDFARELFRKYRADDPVFQWPSTFNQYFPGIYVEQNFGNGCVANISKAEAFLYWHRTAQVSETQDDGTTKLVNKTLRDSVCLLASQPEVLSSNIIDYKVSDYIEGMVAAGKTVLTTPGGYMADIIFPVQRLIDAFKSQDKALSMVSSLRMRIPAKAIENDFGLTAAPYLLMVKKSELNEFFDKNKVPDGVTSFYAAYDSESLCYDFNSMRSYFLKIIEDDQNGEVVKHEDTEFVLVPVDITLETVDNYSSTSVYVTRCQPYLTRPTMTELDTDHAVINFVYSSQQIN